MSDIFEDWMSDQIINHDLNSFALIDFLYKKGIIDFDEFQNFRDDYAKTLFKRHYPDVPVE